MLSEAQKAEVETRLRLVENSLIEGKHEGDIVRVGSAQWSISDRQVKRYIATVKARWRQAGQADEKQRLINLHRAVIQRNDLYRRCLVASDHGNALRALDSRDKLLSLFPTEEQHHTHTGMAASIEIVTIEVKEVARHDDPIQLPSPSVGVDAPAGRQAEADIQLAPRPDASLEI
jgi:hypothetical protein